MSMRTIEIKHRWTGAVLHTGEYESQRAALLDAVATDANLAGAYLAGAYLKNRIAAGECPCCRKEYKHLAKHMAAQHPDYLAATPEEQP